MMNNMTFSEFLKKFSTVSNKFIDELFGMFSEDLIGNYNSFVINSEILRQWLDLSDKKSFDRKIKSEFKNGVNYEIKTIKNKKRGGHNKIVYMLTPDTAKFLSLDTKTETGDLVKDYFLQIEALLNQYKNYIIRSQDEKIKRLLNNQKPKINPESGIIYIFRALDTDLNLYKIGKTMMPKKRFNSYNSGLADDLRVLFRYETKDVDRVEKCMKIWLKTAQYRKYKEIYQVELDTIKKIIKKCVSDSKYVDKLLLCELSKCKFKNNKKSKTSTIKDNDSYVESGYKVNDKIIKNIDDIDEKNAKKILKKYFPDNYYIYIHR